MIGATLNPVMANLNIEFCGVKFANPTVLASGILGITGSSLANVVKQGAGGVTSKSVWLEVHKGHPGPIMMATDSYFLNAVGLPDGGIAKAKEEFAHYRELSKAPLIGNIVAYSIEDFEELAKQITLLKPDIIEVNISCPNVHDEFGTPFSCKVDSAVAVTKAVKKNTNLPVIIKLAPNVYNLTEIAKNLADNGADGFCLINTMPGIAINADLKMPVLSNKSGGVSGPALKPIAMKCVYDVYKATKLPIVATGGVTTGLDAIEMMMAGGRLVGVGSAIHFGGIDVCSKITKEMSEWCDKEGIKNIEEIIGVATNN